jgi:predicted nucleic acid-binding protein
MRLVVDTNRIIAALVRDSASREILLSNKFDFLTIGITKSEIKEHEQEILEKTNLTEEQFNTLISLLFSKIFVVSDMTVASKMTVAEKIMDEIDPSDTPFIALALAVENDGIWSDDKHFEKQNRIKVWKTEELLKLIKEDSI